MNVGVLLLSYSRTSVLLYSAHSGSIRTDLRLETGTIYYSDWISWLCSLPIYLGLPAQPVWVSSFSQLTQDFRWQLLDLTMNTTTILTSQPQTSENLIFLLQKKMTVLLIQPSKYSATLWSTVTAFIKVPFKKKFSLPGNWHYVSNQ